MMSPSSTRRVVVTGLGVISPLGNSPDELFAALAGRKSGVAELSSVPTANFPMSFGAEAREFTGAIGDFGELDKKLARPIKKGLKVMCRETQMGVAASQRALLDAGLAPGGFDPERAGIAFGSDYMMTEPEDMQAAMAFCADEAGKLNFPQWGGEGMFKMPPLWLLKYLPNMPACHVAIYNDLRGPNNSLTQREASGNLAIGEAFHTIRRGSADLMLAGATGTRVHPMKTVHAVQTEQIAASNGRDPAAMSRPFDKDRTGMVVGEGSGVVVLEELESARRRGATIYAEIVGAASSTVLDENFVAQRDRALANAIRATLAKAGAAPDALGHLHAHGLSTHAADIAESRAIREALGDAAERIPVVAAKSYFGNLGAGSGVVEFVASVLALNQGRLFPVLNYETPDPQCPVAAVTEDDASPGESFLNLSFTPQGQASCVMARVFA